MWHSDVRASVPCSISAAAPTPTATSSRSRWWPWSTRSPARPSSSWARPPASARLWCAESTLRGCAAAACGSSGSGGPAAGPGAGTDAGPGDVVADGGGGGGGDATADSGDGGSPSVTSTRGFPESGPWVSFYGPVQAHFDLNITVGRGQIVSQLLANPGLRYVIDWDDTNKTFLIEFSQAGEMQAVLAPPVDEQPFALSYNDDRVLRTTNSPRRNPIFRFNVLKRYGSKCAVCSMTIDNLLSAAHIVPKGSSYSNDDPRNGIVLCHNHHDAFDAYLFGIHPETKKIVQRSKGPSLSDLKIEGDCLSPMQSIPHIDALRWQYKKFEESLTKKF